MNLNGMNQFFGHYATLKSEPDYLTFEQVNQPGNIYINKNGTLSRLIARFVYRINGGAWQKYSFDEANGKGEIIPLVVGDKIQFAAEDVNEYLGWGWSSFGFGGNGQKFASGDLMSLLSRDLSKKEFTTDMECAGLLAFSGLLSTPYCSATKLSTGCFQGCFQTLRVTKAMELPNITDYPNSAIRIAYSGTRIAEFAFPHLVKLDSRVLDITFRDSWIQTLDLSNVQVWGDRCCHEMCLRATKLTTAVLPDLELTAQCCVRAFSGCTSLNFIHVGFTQWLDGATTDWVLNVPPGGTFECPKELPQIFDKDHIPEGWEVKTF